MANSHMQNWQERKTAVECLNYILDEKKFSDVTFTFEQQGGCKVEAHKPLLAMRSRVFEAMFYGPLAKTDADILLKDDEPETFKMMLRYIYTDEVQFQGEQVLKLLYSAKKYCLDGLVKRCSDFLEDCVTSDNVCAIHEQAKFYDMEYLQKQCMKYIYGHANNVFKSACFIEVSKETLASILESSRLGCDEMSAFIAAISWAKGQCEKNNDTNSQFNVRKYLGDIIYQIRFPVLSMDVFAMEVVPTGYLTSDEQLMLYHYYATKGSTSEKVLGKFSTSARSRPRESICFANVSDECRLQTNSTTVPLFVSVKSSDINLHEINGELIQNVSAISLDYQNRRHGQPRVLEPEEWQTQNWRIEFEPGLIMKAGYQTKVTLTLEVPVFVQHIPIKATQQMQNMNISALHIPNGIDEMIFSK